MLADFDPWHPGILSEQAPEEETLVIAEDFPVPEIIEANFELEREKELKLRSLGATSIRPVLLPAA